jgi:hypothetical protein
MTANGQWSDRKKWFMKIFGAVLGTVLTIFVTNLMTSGGRTIVTEPPPQSPPVEPLVGIPVALGLGIAPAAQPVGRVRLFIDDSEVGILVGAADQGGTVLTISLPPGQHSLGATLEDLQTGQWVDVRPLEFNLRQPTAYTVLPAIRRSAFRNNTRIMMTERPIPASAFR